MRVRNKTDHGVFVHNYGVVPAGEEATVPQGESVKELIKAGALSEVKSSSSGSDTEGRDS
jgi:hypothetical protein